jgi:tRNA 2-selenouridine synthase
MMEIDIHEALERSDLVFIDVRSPVECAAASIPGAINIPLFDDQEHHRLGLIYRQEGEARARRVALSIVAPKLPGLVDQISAASGLKTPLLYCRRGGLRSVSLYHILNLSGVQAYRLKRGYKSFRRYVNERLNNYELNKKVYVLHGLTGVGKTAVLEALEEKAVPVINLEALACHRGSVFGAIGVAKTRSQKDFDALLLAQLDQYKEAPYLFIEGESRRIGDIYLPEFLTTAISRGRKILLTAPVATRTRRIVETYTPETMTSSELEAIKTALLSLSRRMGLQKVNALITLLETGQYYKVAEILCTDYYDHFYSDSHLAHTNFEAVIDATDIAGAVSRVLKLVNFTPVSLVKTAP